MTVVIGTLFLGMLISAALARRVKGVGLSVFLFCWTVLISLGTVVADLSLKASNPSGIIEDSSVDALRYYHAGAELAAGVGIPTPLEVSQASGSVLNLFYYYINWFGAYVSSEPVLMVRVLKCLLLQNAIILIVWQWSLRVTGWPLWAGAFFLCFMYWDLHYYNFRNFKDGIISSMVIFTFVILGYYSDHKNEWAQSKERTSSRTWQAALVLLLVLAVTMTRLYVGLILLGVSLLIVVSRARRQVVQTVLIVSGSAVLLGYAGLLPGWDYAKLYFIDRSSLIGGEFMLSVIRGFIAPLPWQYHIKWLSLSHSLYLVLLPLAFVGFYRMRSRRPWAEMVFVLGVCLFLGLYLGDSFVRKRLPVVPFMVGWFVMGMGTVRTLESDTMRPVGSSDKLV